MDRGRTGVLGGTFDPIHIGHLIIAQEAVCRFELDRVIFVPAGVQPLKPDVPASIREHRYNMTALATRDNPAFEVSRMELERPGPSYTVDTLEELHRGIGDGSELFFIAGLDAVLDIMTWHDPERIIELSRIIAATRPGFDVSDVEHKLPGRFLERIHFLHGPGVNVSSTELRSRIEDGLPIKYLVPRAVEDYIDENQLYRTE